MTITEAKKKCEELQEQMTSINEKYFLADHFVRNWEIKEIKPLHSEWSKLQILITKTENETELIK